MANWKHRVIEFDPTTPEREEFLGAERSWNDGGVVVDVQWWARALSDEEIAALVEAPRG